MTSPLALERRSQPAQILQLQREYAELAQRFALDSQVLHSQLLEHDAALVHFRETLDALASDMRRIEQTLTSQTYRLDSRCDADLDFRHRSFWQRVRWMVTGR
jgi:hypothetical protein